MESKIIKKLSINFDKEIVLDNVLVDKEIVQMHQKRLEQMYKDLPEQERNIKINDALRDVILKDNFFNKIMEFIVPYYEFEIDQTEIEERMKQLKESFPERSEDVLKNIAEKNIQKELIFNDLQKQFNLTLTEEQVDENLKKSAVAISEDFDALKQDKTRYDMLKNLLQEEYVISFLLVRFPLRVNLPYDWQTHQIMLFRIPRNQKI